MSLLAQVSEEKLVEYKSKSEQEAAESKAAQEEALRTVLEMMEKDCEERVAELDRELARIDAERARAAEMQAEAARRRVVWRWRSWCGRGRFGAWRCSS